MTENAVLKERIESHSRRLEILEANHRDLSDGLNAIQRSLSQIKWIATGAAVMFVGQELGVIDALKMLV